MDFCFASERRDKKTRATASDALASKHAAAALGYFRDDYVGYFCTGSTVRRPPIINRGYYTRVLAFKKIIESFLASSAADPKRQIVCLGCGFDTISFEYSGSGTTFFELDYAEIVEKKKTVILSELSLTEKIMPTNGSSDDHKKDYGYDLGRLQLIVANLRDANKVQNHLKAAGVDYDAPTLVITECVLVYIEQTFAMELIASLQSSFSVCAWASYDMINPDDSFGRMMSQNLSDAGFFIPGFCDYPSKEAQIGRFTKSLSWDFASSITMSQAHDVLLTAEERAAADKIERLDEVEEWLLLMNHYCITFATNRQSQFIELIRMIPSS